MFKRVLMCPPDYFDVVYKINPWMDDKVDKKLAAVQWLELKRHLENCSIDVLTIQPEPDLPDMVFSCNAGLVYENTVYLSNFRHEQRRRERQCYERWFQANGIEVLGDQSYFFEGGGDAVFSSKNTLWAGHGFRSQKEVYKSVEKLGKFRVNYCRLVNENYYHMDVCFCPLSDKVALWYPDAFDEQTRLIMRKEIELIEIDKREVDNFACNAIAIGQTVILPSNCPNTVEELKKHSFQAVQVEMSEFLKSGGAVQCLILKL